MFTSWFPPPVSFWWPLAFTIAAFIVCMLVVAATLRRRTEEQDALTIAAFYSVGFCVIVVSEFMMFLYAAFGLSLADAWLMPQDLVSFFAIGAVFVAVAAIGAGIVLQFQEERGYQQLHPAH